MNTIKRVLPGLLLSVLIGLVSYGLSTILPFGAVIIGISIGVIVGNVFSLGNTFAKGIAFSEKTVLAWAIILMGVKLDYAVFNELGFKAILILVLSIAFTLIISQLLARVFNIRKRLALLLGIGNAICGSSAIAATHEIIGAKKDEVGLSVTIINLLGTLGMFILPLFAKYILQFSDIHSGFFLGNTLQAVGQVIAAGFSINHDVGHVATIVKMMRILMLTPVVFVLFFYFRNLNKKKKIQVKKQGIPYFIIGFIAMSLLAAFSFIPKHFVLMLGNLSHYLLIVAMVAIGLNIKFISVLKHGKKAMLVGSLIFLFQLIFSIIMIYLV